MEKGDVELAMVTDRQIITPMLTYGINLKLIKT
jgi:hypothetical protein